MGAKTLLILVALFSTSIDAYERSQAAKDAFKATHPCPANRQRSGSCPGYVIDHVKPLDCGGADDPSNMQWQTEAEGKAKDKLERIGCGTASFSGQSSNMRPSSTDSARSGGYYVGLRGGCYTFSASGKKRYVSHDKCR